MITNVVRNNKTNEKMIVNNGLEYLLLVFSTRLVKKSHLIRITSKLMHAVGVRTFSKKMNLIPQLDAVSAMNSVT